MSLYSRLDDSWDIEMYEFFKKMCVTWNVVLIAVSDKKFEFVENYLLLFEERHVVHRVESDKISRYLELI